MENAPETKGSTINQIEYIFNPETVAVVGAASTFGKWGFDVFQRSYAPSSSRRVYPINKNAAEVQGVKAYPTIKDLPEPVDFVVIVVPYTDVLEVMKQCVDTGVKAALIISAGLAETGSEGAKLQAEIVRTARKGGVRLVGPNCMGNFNTANGFCTLRQGITVNKGEVGVISQSGGFGAHILQSGREMGVGFSKFVSIGNEADLHFEDFLEYLGQDSDTRVITGYIEGLRQGERFLELAQNITRQKPIVIVKVGRTEAGARAARSHTSAVAGSDAIYDVAFKQAGVIRVEGVEELFDVASALLRQPLPKGNRVGILTPGGGFACVASDACERHGLKIAPLSPTTIERLNSILPPRWPHGNPVDTVAAGFVTYPCLWPLIEDPDLDAVLAVHAIGYSAMLHEWAGNAPTLWQERAERAAMRREQEELEGLDRLFTDINRYQKPVILSGTTTDMIKRSPIFEKLKENGVLMYPTIERAVKVLAHLLEYSQYLNHA